MNARPALVLVALALLAGCASPETTTTTTSPAQTTAPATTTAPVTTTAPATTTTPPPASGTAAVSISGFAFDPPTLRVTAGTNVTWTNADATGHTATGGAFDSGRLDEGDAFSFVFSAPGTFEYRCSIHSSMKGTVVVS